MKSILSKSLAVIFRHPAKVFLLLLLVVIWTIPHTHYSGVITQQIQGQYAALPRVRVDLHPSNTFRNRFSTNKTALYIETRNEVNHTVAPLLFHMMQVAPPEWRFVFLGTDELVGQVNMTAKGRYNQEIGKLRLESLEPWTQKWAEAEAAKQGGKKDKEKPPPLGLDEVKSRLLTNATFYDEVLPGVEHLLTFKSSAMLCSNSKKTLNDYLEYDWVGAPWNIADKFGGDGGLTLRRVSTIKTILSFQARRDDTVVEDSWLTSRIGLLPSGNPAAAEIEQTFAVQGIWYDTPLGYHVPADADQETYSDVWGSKEKRDAIYDYCPEIKIILPMRLERERCPPKEEGEGDKVNFDEGANLEIEEATDNSNNQANVQAEAKDKSNTNTKSDDFTATTDLNLAGKPQKLSPLPHEESKASAGAASKSTTEGEENDDGMGFPPLKKKPNKQDESDLASFEFEVLSTTETENENGKLYSNGNSNDDNGGDGVWVGETGSGSGSGSEMGVGGAAAAAAPAAAPIDGYIGRH